MRITVGHHPDLPFPFSNAPEPPIPEPRGLPHPLMTLARDLEQGDHWIREALSWWVTRSHLTTRQMATIAAYGLGERGALEHSIISRITNRKIGPSIKSLIGMEAANNAIWLWQTKGQDATWAKLGPHPAWKIQPHWLDGAIWLPVPDESDHPLDLGDFVDVWVGRLELPYLGNRLLMPNDHRRTAEHLPALLDATIVAAGLSPMAGVRGLLAAYPAADEARRERFRGVILGEQQLTRDELQEELLAIAEAVRTLRELPIGSYGPAELLAELLAMAQQG
jgi:hypothetical protein